RQMRWITWTVCIIAVFIIIILLITLYYSRRRRQYIMALHEKHLNTKPYTSVQVIEESEPAEGAHKNLAETTPDDGEDKEEKISPELVKAMVSVMENSREIFDPEFQMARLCAMLGSNTTYVSRAVNSYYGKPFKNVLAERRIAEACRRLDNPVDNASLTIEAICLEVGFKSRSAFSVAFKNVTGLTPTEYRKAAQKYMSPK
ncbi:MAG: helix-turn-helix domain-containing protein, partial [Muribaculaceae bacterium]|nr:helix-turn-helix domain-containing protein [Muribaculaceae bacterium]